MKTINFQSQQFSVPSWAKYITQDIDGYYVWECEPLFNKKYSTYFWQCERYKSVYPVENVSHTIMKLEG